MIRQRVRTRQIRKVVEDLSDTVLTFYLHFLRVIAPDRKRRKYPLPCVVKRERVPGVVGETPNNINSVLRYRMVLMRGMVHALGGVWCGDQLGMQRRQTDGHSSTEKNMVKGSGILNHDNRSSRKSCISSFSVFFGPCSSVGSGGASVRPGKKNQTSCTQQKAPRERHYLCSASSMDGSQSSSSTASPRSS